MNIFDKNLVRRRRKRAGGENFLLEEAEAILTEKLRFVKKEFTAPLEITREGFRTREGPVAGDEELLPFAPESFDLVKSAMVFHNTNDLPGSLAQIRRVLKPEGLFIACFPGEETLAALKASFATAEAARGGASPRVSPFLDLREAGNLLQRAGFRFPVAELDRISARYPDALSLMKHLKSMGESNPLAARAGTLATKALLLEAAAYYAEVSPNPQGGVEANFELVTILGWK